MRLLVGDQFKESESGIYYQVIRRHGSALYVVDSGGDGTLFNYHALIYAFSIGEYIKTFKSNLACNNQLVLDI